MNLGSGEGSGTFKVCHPLVFDEQLLKTIKQVFGERGAPAQRVPKKRVPNESSEASHLKLTFPSENIPGGAELNTTY